jgi:hypothetical protein
MALDREYDLLVNLEDEPSTAAFAAHVRHGRLFGGYLDKNGAVAYSEDARAWFDLSLIIVHGRARGRRTKAPEPPYQELRVRRPRTDIWRGTVCAASAGRYPPHRRRGDCPGCRAGLANEGLGDVSNHRCLVSGDSLPMHFTLGTGTSFNEAYSLDCVIVCEERPPRRTTRP